MSSLLSALTLLVAAAQAAPMTHGPGPSGPPSGAASGPSYAGTAGEVRVATPRLERAAVHVDGVLDEVEWASAAVLDGFTQYDPAEGTPASQRTEVLVFVTPEAIHFGIRAFDDDPAGVRASLAERDNVARNDDYVRIILDTFDDQSRAYAFTVNPLGVQQDGLWIEGSATRRGGFGDPIDDNPDFIWESGGRVQSWGWSAEVKIPFKSLRFPKQAEQSWGLNIFRRIQRTGFQQAWAPITGNVSNKLTQSGTLEGLTNLNPGLFLEFNPVLTARRIGLFDDEAGRLVRADPEGDFGMDVRYGLTSNLTVDATYNPDFSQVEADAGQIVTNERFAIFFPEKRPFFLEGTEIFALPRQLIYTRSIVNPVGGAKLTGKVGSLNLGYLGAVDEMDGSDDTVVNLLRLRRDLGGSSTAGLLYTDRSGGGSFNRVGGGDTRLVLGRRYTLSLLGALSWTGAPDEATRRGSFLYARFQRSGRAFSFESEIEDADSDFVAGSGFIRRVGATQTKATVRRSWYGKPGALIEQFGPFAELEGAWKRDDFWAGRGMQERSLRAGFILSLKRNMTAFVTYSRSRFSFDGSDYEGLFVAETGAASSRFLPDMSLFSGMDGVSVRGFFSPWERVRGNFALEYGERPVFDRRFDVPVEPADRWGGNLSLTLLPTASLRAEVGVRHETLLRKSDGSRASTATIPRIRVQYQFSRALFLRGIAEYASQERTDLRDPATGRAIQSCDQGMCVARSGLESNDLHVETLLAYEPSPGTVFFLGYTRDMEDPEAFGFRSLTPTTEGLFLKLSYRFRY